MAGRPRKHSTQDVLSHKTKAEIAQKKEEEALAGQENFKRLSTTPPETLIDDVAKKEYRRVVPLLNNLDVTALDRTIVINYCNSYSMYLQAIEDVKKNGVVLKGRKNPAFNVYLDMQRELRATSGQLGMTLDSRTKLIKVEEHKEEKDPYEELDDIQ